MSGSNGLAEMYDVNTDNFLKVPEEAIEAISKRRIAALAKRITSNKHFAKILMQAKPALRKGVYEEIVPHLTFKPLSYRMVMLLK